jgi:light-regulated signal transduction histidine kinase (bacteriophytochrome)
VETDYVSDALYKTARTAAERERELAETKGRLEEQVAARTRELAETNGQLRIANRELESFAHLAVNDLREPLRTISGYTHSLREEFERELPEDVRFYSERIQNAATRMNRLLESIFAYSKVSTPHRELKLVNLNAVLEEVLGDLELRLRETGGRVVAGELGSVMADHADLHQLLLNLVGNALKFRRDGVAPVVEVESGRVGADIHLVIKDNGIGFDPRHAERIFAPFQRLETERRYEGTGMGLAIVRRIAERQGGSVHATSVPGAGSQFVVILRASSLGRKPAGPPNQIDSTL